MTTKKHPKANLENYSKLFAQLGLVLSLAIVYLLIQNKTYTKDVIAMSYSERILIDDSEELVEVLIEKQKPKPKIKKTVLVDIVKADDEDDIIEDIIGIIDIDAPFDPNDIVDVDFVVDIIEEVPFLILEDAPVFPGCEGDKEELRACFINKIRKFVNKKFDANLAGELNLSSGKQKIFTLFKIDKNGNIVDIQARAPHKKLREEAIRVISLLPQMKPGKQRGNAVAVKYSLPIVFIVE